MRLQTSLTTLIQFIVKKYRISCISYTQIPNASRYSSGFSFFHKENWALIMYLSSLTQFNKYIICCCHMFDIIMLFIQYIPLLIGEYLWGWQILIHSRIFFLTVLYEIWLDTYKREYKNKKYHGCYMQNGFYYLVLFYPASKISTDK